jgi:aspartyl aminopeptidase
MKPDTQSSRKKAGGPAETATDLLDFIDASPTAFHAVACMSTRLTSAGFSRLDEADEWNLDASGAYFTVRGGSSCIAFRPGRKDPAAEGFRIAGAHTDSPCLKLKLESAASDKGYLCAATQVYGGPIISSWLDRPLALAGRIVCRDGKDRRELTVCSSEVFAIAPNTAIHLNRKINEGFEYNKQDHLRVLFGSTADVPGGGAGTRGAGKLLDEPLIPVLSEALGPEAAAAIKEEQAEADLYLTDRQPGFFFGAGDALINASRIDDLAGCHAVLEALIREDGGGCPQIAVFFDHEEVGSRSEAGAVSSFLKDIMHRICAQHRPQDSAAQFTEKIQQARARSFIISVDGAHALHPNFSDAHDSAYAPLLNGGPVLKSDAGMKYASTASSAARFTGHCRRAGVPVQRFIIRSDKQSGSTIGPISSSATGIAAVDIGIPMLAMHSIRETAGSRDQDMMLQALRSFYRGG